MDLTFQISVQYCSLQHQTSLSPPVTFTTGCCFHFGSASSLLLEPFLCSSPGAYWTPAHLGSSSFNAGTMKDRSGMDLEPDILECEVRRALGSIIVNKASGGDGIPAELFKILKDDAVSVLL